MTPKAVSSKIESCALQLHAWKPFDPPFNPKKPCRSDRSTAPNPSPSPDLDFSKLSLLDDPQRDSYAHTRRWFQRKRRRRGSRSVSGRSSDRSGTHRRASAAYATCSDFPLAAGGTDSSGELFVNGEGSWGSDVSESRVLRREIGREIERESCYGFQGNEVLMLPGNESGYGSEPGYRGDGELGEEDGEFDEEEEDGKLMFWGDRFGGVKLGSRGLIEVGKAVPSSPHLRLYEHHFLYKSNGMIQQSKVSACAPTAYETDRMEIVGENNFSEQKAHHRCRRKKHDWRLIAPLR